MKKKFIKLLCFFVITLGSIFFASMDIYGQVPPASVRVESFIPAPIGNFDEIIVNSEEFRPTDPTQLETDCTDGTGKNKFIINSTTKYLNFCNDNDVLFKNFSPFGSKDNTNEVSLLEPEAKVLLGDDATYNHDVRLNIIGSIVAKSGTTPDSVPAWPANTKGMLYDAEKSSFLVGTDKDGSWSTIGNYSVALGYANSVPVSTAIALGTYNIVNGARALAFGRMNTNNAISAGILGYDNIIDAGSNRSLSIGQHVHITGGRDLVVIAGQSLVTEFNNDNQVVIAAEKGILVESYGTPSVFPALEIHGGGIKFDDDGDNADNVTATVSEQNVVMATAAITGATGALGYESGVTSALRTGVGIYIITYNIGYFGSAPNVTATALCPAATPCFAYLTVNTAASTTVRVINTAGVPFDPTTLYVTSMGNKVWKDFTGKIRTAPPPDPG